MRKRLLFLIVAFTFCLIFSITVNGISVSAKGCVLMEADSGEIVYQKNGDTRLPMASTTKIMTAIVVIENEKLDKVVKIEPCMTGIEGSSIYLTEGEELTVLELLYALMLESANDASVALAYTVSDSIEEFSELMNKKATELGLKDTHFTNPHGLDDEEHYTTAHDLGIIAAYAMKNPTFKEIVSTYKKVIPLNNGEGSRVLINHNRLLRAYKGAIGIKTGYTKKCGRCLVSCAMRDGVTLICVTLNASNDWNDHASLLDYGFEQYESVLLASPFAYTISLNAINGNKDSFLAENTEELRVTLRKGHGEIIPVLEYDRLLSAPISKGQRVGRIAYFLDGEEIGYVNLFAKESVKGLKYKKSIIERLFG